MIWLLVVLGILMFVGFMYSAFRVTAGDCKEGCCPVCSCEVYDGVKVGNPECPLHGNW